jgi:hypothetical protein
MEAGSSVFIIKATLENKSVTPDLTRLQEALEQQGFRVKVPLEKLQTGQEAFSQIVAQPHFLGRFGYICDWCFVSRDKDVFKLVASMEAMKLAEFAENYKPIPYLNK